ncbi:MAG TPA: metallophosphoesterase [Albitalea sp.]
MTMLLHISDPHFGTEQPPVVEALLRLAAQEHPELVMLSGDITQRARRSQFRAARGFVDRLGDIPTLVIPGNHDIPLFNLAARLLAPYANFERAFGAELEPVHESARLLLIALNTTRPRRHKNGELSREQIERVARRLRAAQHGQLRAVVVHQPIAVTRPEDEHNLLRGHAAAIEAWSAAGADLVLGGHIHLPYVLALHERLPGLARRLWAVQAGTAVSRRVREGAPNSVNLIRWGDALPSGRCVIERWDYSAAAGGFGPAGTSTLDTGWRANDQPPPIS